MRWKQKQKTGPVDGDIKTVKKFLLVPMLVNGEWRWLEVATFRAMILGDEHARKEVWTPIFWVG